MLTLKQIKTLAQLTENTEIIKVAMQLSNGDFKYIIRLFDMFKGEPGFSQEGIDVILENYIRQRLIEGKTPIEKLVESKEFRKKIFSLTRTELDKYMELCDKNDNNELLTNKTILANYNAQDHFAIIDIGSKISKKNKPKIKELFFNMVLNRLPVNFLHAPLEDLINYVEECLTDINYKEITKLLSSNNFYNLYRISPPTIIKIISEISQIQEQRIRKLLTNIALAGDWQYLSTDFKIITGYALKSTPSNQFLLEKESTYDMRYEDITEMLSITEENYHLISIFANDILCDFLTNGEILNLIRTYNLKNEENFNKFISALNVVIQKELTCSFYDELCTELDSKCTYQETVSQYLETCDSISDFIDALNGNFKDSDPVGPNSMLTLNIYQ